MKNRSGSIDVEAFRGALSQISRAGTAAVAALAPAGEALDRMRYRMLVMNMMRAHSMEEAQALHLLKQSRRIRNGKRRHGAVKHARDKLRAARR